MNLKTLTNLELGQFRAAIDRELLHRTLNNQPREKPTMLGDPDGDVLWKHHGVSEVEAMDDAYEME